MYCIVALGVMSVSILHYSAWQNADPARKLCVVYYWVRFRALPEWCGYEIIEETVTLPGGVKASVPKRRYKGEQEPLLQGQQQA